MISDGKKRKESSTNNHLGCELQKIKGVWSCPNVKTLETATTIAKCPGNKVSLSP